MGKLLKFFTFDPAVELTAEQKEAKAIGMENMMKDVATGKVEANFSVRDGDEAIRDFVFNYLGLDKKDSKIKDKLKQKMKRSNNREDFAELTQIIIEAATGETLTTQLDGWAEFKDLDHASENIFTYEDNSLFDVHVHVNGSSDIVRNRFIGDSYSVPTVVYSVGTYMELISFLTGQRSFQAYIERVVESIANKIGTDIWTAIATAYHGLQSQFFDNSGDLAEFYRIVEKVRAKSRRGVTVWGSIGALSRFIDAEDSSLFTEVMKNTLHRDGFVRNVRGVSFGMLPALVQPSQAPFTVQEFVFDNNTLIIVPSEERIVKVVKVGENEVFVDPHAGRVDLQMEFLIKYEMGALVAKNAIFGMFKFQST
jgi:hypothetical protein